MAMFDWKELPDGKVLQSRFGFKKVELLNDFEAVGYCSCNFDGSETISLNHPSENFPNFDPKPNTYQKYIIVGPGTGLGVAGVTKKYLASSNLKRRCFLCS